MKNKILVFSLLLFSLILFGCEFNNTPTKKVESLLMKYQNNSESVSKELDDYVKSEEIDLAYQDKYKEVFLKQYRDLKYEIKDEKIDGNTAEVTAQIEVYDYYKTQTEVSTYITNHQDEFNTNGIFDNNKVLEYKIKELTNTKDKVTYTIVFNLTKVNDTWTIDNLSEEELEKAYDTGYKEGAEEVINRVSKWLDDYTIQSLREQFLGE